MTVNRLEPKGSAQAAGRATGGEGAGLVSCPPQPGTTRPDSSGVQPIVGFAGMEGTQEGEGSGPQGAGDRPAGGIAGQGEIWVVCVVPSCPEAAGKAMATGPCQ